MAREVVTFAIEAQLNDGSSPAAWTDLTPDVLTLHGVHAMRGSTRNGPMDLVADAGSFVFSLRNDSQNSGHTRAWYSPNHPSVRTGWVEGIPVRLRATYVSTPYAIWYGKIASIDVIPGQAPQYVTVTAHDAPHDFAAAKVREIPPQINQSEVQLLQAVIAAMPTETQPIAMSYDAALDSYPFAYDNVGNGALALGLINDAVVNAFGVAFVTGGGTFTYLNRHTLALKTTRLTLADAQLLVSGPGFVGPNSLANVYNRVRVTIHEREETPSAVLFRSTVAVQIQPGDSVEVWDTYSDPDNRYQYIGGHSFTALAATTDYTANTADDGGGDDRTADLSISITAFETTAKSVLMNIGPDAFYVTMRQLRGTAIFDLQPVTVESSISATYERTLEVDLSFQNDQTLAQDFADFLLATYSNRARQGDALVFDPHQSSAKMLAALTMEIGDVVTASETQTGLSAVEFVVRGVEWLIEAGHKLAPWTARVRLYVSPRVGSTVFIFDDPVFGLFDGIGLLGYA